MQTNPCNFGLWLVFAALLAPGSAGSADDGPVPTQEDSSGHVERLVPVLRISPMYPRRALNNGTSGFVEFQVTVNPDGTVRDLRVIRAEPPGVFEDAASKALRRWKFKPKLVDGKAVEATGSQWISFEMQGARKNAKDADCEKLRTPVRTVGTLPERRIKRLEAAMNLVADGDLPGAESALIELVGGARNDYERAVVLQALGYVYAKQQKDDMAISSYEQALAANRLSWSTHDEITFTLAKLHLINGRQEEGMQLLDTHLSEACAPLADAVALKKKLAARTPSP